MYNEQDLELLLSDYFLGNLDKESSEAVDEFILSSDDNHKIAQQVCRVTNIASRISALKNVDTEKALKNVHYRIAKSRRVHFWSKVQRAAAILAVPLLAGAILLSVKYFQPSQSSLVEMKTTSGMTSHVTLPDGSEVWLNSNSTLTYPSEFDGKSRNVTLDGEGYFKVTRQNGKTFIVSANGVDVEVLGTEFNVEAYSGMSKNVRTTLVTGKINLSYNDVMGQRHCQSVEPGQTYRYDTTSEKLTLEEVNPVTAVSWKEGKIVLDNTSLADALRMIGNRFDVEFVVRNESLLKNKYTGTITKQRLEVILEYFKHTTDIHFEFVSRGIDSPDVSEKQVIIVY